MVNSQNKFLSQKQIAVLNSRGWLSIQGSHFRKKLLKHARPRQLEAGQGLYSLGDDTKALYGIVTGHLDVIIAPHALPPLLVHIGGPGWWFGEAALISGTFRRAGITARTDCLLAQIPEDAILAICAEEPEAWRRLGQLNVSMFDHALAMLHAATAKKPIERVRMVLMQLIGHERVYGEGDNGDPVSIPITQLELGEMVHLGRNATGSVLRELSGIGAIRLDYGAIVVVNRTKLLA